MIQQPARGRLDLLLIVNRQLLLARIVEHVPVGFFRFWERVGDLAQRLRREEIIDDDVRKRRGGSIRFALRRAQPFQLILVESKHVRLDYLEPRAGSGVAAWRRG